VHDLSLCDTGNDPWSQTPSTTSVYAKLMVSTDNGLTFVQSGNVIKIKGENGQSIDIQYSVDGTNWTYNPSGAKYIRTGTKIPPATTFTYTAGVKFVPELGVEYTVTNGQTS